MGWRTTLSLLVVVAGLVAVLEFTRERPPEQGNVSVSLLDGRRLGSAVRIQWQMADLAPIELKRTPGEPFRMTLPIDDLASVDWLSMVARTYDSAMIGETPLPDTEENRRRTGLDAPQLVVDIDFEDGTSRHLEFGAEGPLGTDVFVRRDGRIHRGGLALVSSLRVGLDDLRERSVWRSTAPLVREVVVDRKLPDGARETLRLRRQGDGWELFEPIQARADTRAAESFVRNILSLRIDVFPDGVIRLPEGPADIVLVIKGGPRDEKLDLWLDGQSNMFGRLDERRISFKSLNSQYIQIFVNDIEALRSRVLLPLPDFYHEVVTLIVEPGDGAPRIVLHRDSPDQLWRMQEPIQGEVEPTAVNELLTAVNNMQALAFLPEGADAASRGIRSDGLSVAVQGVTDSKPLVVRLGNDASTGGLDVTYAARADGMTEIVTVPRGAVDVIRRPWPMLVPLRIFTIQDAVTRVVLQHQDGRSRQLVVDDAGRWIDGAGAAVRDDEIADYVDRLRDLRAKKVMLARTLGLGPPDWSLVMGRRSDPVDPIGFGALEVWDREGQPLVVRSRAGNSEVASELSPTDSRNLRQLWQ